MSRKHRASGGRGEKSQKNTQRFHTHKKNNTTVKKVEQKTSLIKGIVEHFGGKHDQIDILEDS